MSRILPAETLRIYKVVHSWVGIVAGLALFIAFYAGALTVFKGPLSQWMRGEQAVPSVPLAQADVLIERTLAVRPDARSGFSLRLQQAPGEDARVSLSWGQGRHGDHDQHDDHGDSHEDSPRPQGAGAHQGPEDHGDHHSPSGHQPPGSGHEGHSQGGTGQWTSALDASGELVVIRAQDSGGAVGVGNMVDSIHRTVGLPGSVHFGSMIMGIVSALYVIALVSGLILWLPSARKDFLAMRMGRSPKRVWLDAHNVIGVASLPFHLVIALTAVVFGLHDTIYTSLDHTIYNGQVRQILQSSNPQASALSDPRPARMLAPADLLARVHSFSPDLQVQMIQYRNPGTRAATAVVQGTNPRYLGRSHGFMLVSPVSGAILNTDYLPGHQGAWAAVVSAFFALHFGSFGGEPVRWGYFLLALAGAFLFYSGNWLWIAGQRRSLEHAGVNGPTRGLRAMEALTVGGVLGCIGGLSLVIALGKLLYAQVTPLQTWLWGAYYLFFLGALAWAWWRGARAAMLPLLLCCVLATLAIPLVSWLVAGGWSAGGFSLAGLGGVDLGATIAACVLLWLAWRQWRAPATGTVAD